MIFNDPLNLWLLASDTTELLGDLRTYKDICIYLHDKFEIIKQTHPLKAYITPKWPSDDEIEQLVEKSSGHFMYASTVIKYIENSHDEPQWHLDNIIKLQMTSCNPYMELDAFISQYPNLFKS